MQKKFWLLIFSLLGVFVASTLVSAVEISQTKLNVTEFFSTTDWSHAFKTLLNGKYLKDGIEIESSPNIFGDVSRGPFIWKKEKREASVVLIMRKRGGTYFLLSKPLSDLNSFEKPTMVESLGDDSPIYVVNAPTFLGYSKISTTGLNVLTSLVNNRKWSISRESEWADGSELKKEILQTVTFFISRKRSDLSLSTYAEAFGSKSSEGFIYGTRNIFEQVTVNGAYRFLFWDGGEFSTVDSQLINASDKISLYPDDKVCIGKNCRSLDEVNLTRRVSPKYIVIEANPSVPDQLSFELNQVDIESPVLKFQYSAPMPVQPAMPVYCSSYSSADLRATKPGFKCSLSEFGHKGSVLVMTRVERAGFGVAWKDAAGVIWSDNLSGPTDYRTAEKVCANVQGRLPHRDDVNRMRSFYKVLGMGRQIWINEKDVFANLESDNFYLDEHHWWVIKGKIYAYCVSTP